MSRFTSYIISNHKILVVITLVVGVIPLAGYITLPRFSQSSSLFSTDRALMHLEFIASDIRSVGSPGHEQSREYLFKQLLEMGTEPILHETTSILRFPGATGFSAGSVKNIIARIPGTASTGAIVLNAHYDGASTGPAAADCGACVITVLEIARLVLEAIPLKNDLIIVLSDAEELGDLGAHAFASQHPWMKDVQLALNFEAMGSSGPVYMYATNQNNAQLIEEYARIVPGSITNSFFVGLFGLVPEQRLACDLQDYLNEGIPGYGFVFTGNSSNYHTELDNIDHLSHSTVREMGLKTLSLVTHFGNSDLRLLENESRNVFFSVWPGLILHYPSSWSLPLAAFSFFLVIIIAWRKYKSGLLNMSLLAKATISFVLVFFLIPIIILLIWYGIKVLNQNLNAFLIGNWAVGWFLVGLILLSVALTIYSQKLLRRKIPFEYQYSGVLAVISLLTLPIAWIFPDGSYLLIWPALAGAILLTSFFTSNKSIKDKKILLVIILIPLIVVSITLFGPILYLNNPFTALLIRLDALTGLPLLALVTLFSVILVGYLHPAIALLAENQPERYRQKYITPLIIAIFALIATGIGWINSGFNRDHPYPESIRYELDYNTNKANWVSGDHILGEWTSNFISRDSHLALEESSSLLFDWPTNFSTPAPLVPLPAPVAEKLDDRYENGARTVQILLKTLRSASVLRISIESETEILKAELENQQLRLDDYPLADEGILMLNYVATPSEGIQLILQVRGKTQIKISLIDIKNGLKDLPSQHVPERPKTTMPSPLSDDCTVVRNEIWL